MRLSKIIKQRRKELTLSQQDLANKAGLSLATVQNIEANKANPEWLTVQNLLEALGLELNTNYKHLDLENLIHLGCPLITDKKMQFKPNRYQLIHELNDLAIKTTSLKKDTRELAAVCSFLCAIRDHYPSVWKETPNNLKKWFKNNIQMTSIKLRRLSLEKLGSYL